MGKRGRGGNGFGAGLGFRQPELRHSFHRPDHRLVGNGIEKPLRPAVLAHAQVSDQGVGSPAQHVLWQGAEIAEYPEQIDALPEAGPDIAVSDRRYQSQHAPA